MFINYINNINFNNLLLIIYILFAINLLTLSSRVGIELLIEHIYIIVANKVDIFVDITNYR